MEIYGCSTSHAVSSNALAFCRALECEWFLVPWAAGHQVRQLYWSLPGALHANSFCLNIAGLVLVLIILILDDFVHVNVQTQASPSTQKQMYSGYMLINFESIWWDMCPHFLSHWRRLHDCILALTLWCPCCSTKKHILWWFESPSLWWLVGYIMLNPHHLVVKSSLSGSLKKLLSNRFPISFPLQAFASAILAIFAVSLEWWWHAQLGMSSMWDELHMEDLLDVRTGTQSSELLNAVDSAFWKRLKRKCSLNFKHF